MAYSPEEQALRDSMIADIEKGITELSEILTGKTDNE